MLGSPYATSCGGGVDPNYAFNYFGGSVTVNTAPLTITAASPTMTYGGTVPTISPLYTGFKNGDTGSSIAARPPVHHGHQLEHGGGIPLLRLFAAVGQTRTTPSPIRPAP